MKQIIAFIIAFIVNILICCGVDKIGGGFGVKISVCLIVDLIIYAIADND